MCCQMQAPHWSHIQSLVATMQMSVINETKLPCLYYDKRRDIRWNIAWAQGKSGGWRPRDFSKAKAIFHQISQLESWYRHFQFLKIIRPALSFPVGQYWKSWFSVLVWQLGLYFLVLPIRWSNTGPYGPSGEFCCGSTCRYTWSGEKY